jgi:hypothetical protein
MLWQKKCFSPFARNVQERMLWISEVLKLKRENRAKFAGPKRQRASSAEQRRECRVKILLFSNKDAAERFVATLSIR